MKCETVRAGLYKHICKSPNKLTAAIDRGKKIKFSRVNAFKTEVNSDIVNYVMCVVNSIGKMYKHKEKNNNNNNLSAVCKINDTTIPRLKKKCNLNWRQSNNFKTLLWPSKPEAVDKYPITLHTHK